jgi:hypothetical protein
MEEEREALTPEAAAEPQTQETDDNSPMARLRELRRKSRESKDLTLEVPGYEGFLGIRYKAVPLDELQKIRKNNKKDDVDLLIYLCESAMVKADEESDFEPLEDEHGNPVRFDANLAKYLDIEIRTERKARECVEGVFSLDIHPLAATTHAKHIVQWMKGVDASSDSEFLGE